jgi:hypothetical protein
MAGKVAHGPASQCGVIGREEEGNLPYLPAWGGDTLLEKGGGFSSWGPLPGQQDEINQVPQSLQWPGFPPAQALPLNTMSLWYTCPPVCSPVRWCSFVSRLRIVHGLDWKLE